LNLSGTTLRAMSHTSSRKRFVDLVSRMQDSMTLEEPLATTSSSKADLSMK